MTIVTATAKPLQAPWTIEYSIEGDEFYRVELSTMLVRIFRLMNTYTKKIKHYSKTGVFQAEFNVPGSMHGFSIIVKAESVGGWDNVQASVADIHQILMGVYTLPPLGDSVVSHEVYNFSRNDDTRALGKACGSYKTDNGGWLTYSEDELPNEIMEFYEDYLS